MTNGPVCTVQTAVNAIGAVKTITSAVAVTITWTRSLKNMSNYHYCVNTFKDNEPVQLYGDIEAENEEDAIQKLIDDGTVYPRAYEFLELKKWINGRNLILRGENI